MGSYRTSTIKRSRRTKAQVAQLDRQIIEVLRDDHPQSVRHVFYRMTEPWPEPVPKTDRGYRAVQNRLVKLRRSGAIPYGWIADMTRSGYHVHTFSDASDFLKQSAGRYRADLWRDADHYVEVWTESRSIASVILNDCVELAVSLYPCGGFSSISLAYQAADYVNASYDGRDFAVIYIGDYDPAGVLIDAALERELREHLDPDISMTFERLAITPAQIKRHNLPTKPRKAGDKRSLHIEQTVEAEAMPARILRKMLRERIEAMLPQNALAVAKAAEASERAHIHRMAELLGNGRFG